jgi:hypothetical protein
MQTYSINDIEVKIKRTEEKYQKQVLKGAAKDLLHFLKSEIEYLKRLREEAMAKG